MRAIKPPEQMGMLMSAGSASSPLTGDVVRREGLEVKERLSYQTGGKTLPYQGW